jgi:hypothetical protein
LDPEIELNSLSFMDYASGNILLGPKEPWT